MSSRTLNSVEFIVYNFLLRECHKHQSICPLLTGTVANLSIITKHFSLHCAMIHDSISLYAFTTVLRNLRILSISAAILHHLKVFSSIDFLFSQSKGVTEDGIKLALPLSSSKSDRTSKIMFTLNDPHITPMPWSW